MARLTAMKTLRFTCATLMLSCAAMAASAQDGASSDLSQRPQLDAQGRLLRPADLDRWVHLGTMLGPQYSASEFNPDSPGNFHVALMEPLAYENFLDTGEFADGTMFALVFYTAVDELSIQKSGYLMGDVEMTEIHLKDSKRFSTGFNFFNFHPGNDVGSEVALPNGCVDCHTEHGALDGVFVQFYPTLRTHLPGAIAADAGNH